MRKSEMFSVQKVSPTTSFGISSRTAFDTPSCCEERAVEQVKPFRALIVIANLIRYPFERNKRWGGCEGGGTAIFVPRFELRLSTLS